MKKTILSLSILSVLCLTILVKCNKSTINQTTMVVKNNDTIPVLVYFTLGGVPASDTSKWVQSVYNIFGITDSGLVGSFTLAAGDSLTYTPSKGIQTPLPASE